jgi:tripeptide aminopeptidase
MNSQDLSIVKRFFRYVQIDTQSNPASNSFPSTDKQKNLLSVLAAELLEMGIVDAHMDAHGYVYATIPANTNKTVPAICFCSHADTAPDCSGTNVKPILHNNYQGQHIVLPDDASQVITTTQHPYLISKIGDDLITASGLTLLGADDKAGVAIIMDFAHYLLANPNIIHGPIRILFTPDEEVGRGVEQIDMKKLNAQYGYTLDGGELGSIEDETFSADGVVITINGISAHPGYAKDKLVNALKVASHFIDSLPKDGWSPETTSDRNGFVHPMSIEGNIEQVVIKFIIRDFETNKLKEHELLLQQILNTTIAQFVGATASFEVKEQYRNMHEKIREVPFLIDYAKLAMERAGVTPLPMLIRGGTDGSRLSFMGMPCPNLFTGEMAIHSKHEFVSVQDMLRAKQTLVELVQIFEQQA